MGSPFLGSEPTERGYTGHEHLDHVELIHMNGRVQDPKLGRFISADPLVQAPYHSQSINRYSYVWNNPLTLVDPSGFDARTRQGRVPPGGNCEELDYLCGDPCLFLFTCDGLDTTEQLWLAETFELARRVGTGTFVREQTVQAYYINPVWEFFQDVSYSNTAILSRRVELLNAATTMGPIYVTNDYDEPIGLLTGLPPTPEQVQTVAISSIGIGAVGSARAVGGARAGAPFRVNPTGSSRNCVNCAIAGDATLAGVRTEAAASGTRPISVIERAFGRKFAPVPSREAIEALLLEAGPGARGIVYGRVPGRADGHVFNAINQGGRVNFPDFQTGRGASFEGLEDLRFLRTN